VGVDVGGSFTDFAVFDETDASISTPEVSSRPDAPGEEILAGLAVFAARDGVEAVDVTCFTHGTPVGVNTVIQRNGHDLALFTTAGVEALRSCFAL
jgi:N-methylhydantoinase A